MTESTICATATAPGGAIGIIRVSGKDAIVIVNRIFTKDIINANGYTIHFGQITDNTKHDIAPKGKYTDQQIITQHPNAECIDDVIVSVFRAPHSYTGEDSVEISCHGSQFILQQIIMLLIANGCNMAAPGEFTKRAFLNGKMDLSQAEAVADLIASHNASQHRVAMNQLRGGITSRLNELHDKLLHLTSLLELELDFSDHEDLEFADRSQLISLAEELKAEIYHLTSSFTAGNAIKNGIPVAIIGAPNVGKSTLLNALLQDDKAIVSDIQGTTRDTIEDTITIHGHLFRFIDTAGIRNTSDKIEALGIERSRKAADKARIIILMRDNENDYPTISARPDQIVIKIHNKSLQFQAINGKGLPELIDKLVASIPSEADDEILITNIRHKQALDLSLLDIQRSIDSMHANLSGDLISEDLRQCLSHLSEIIGNDITPDTILSNIFKHFCIGK